MGKLTVANLFHTIRALGDAKSGPSPPAALIGESFWRLTDDALGTSAQGTGASLGADELFAAVRQVFNSRDDRLISAAFESSRRMMRHDDRLLRFDPEHHDRRLANNGNGTPMGGDSLAEDPARFHIADDAPAESAKDALIKAIGAVQARETLELQHWVIVAVDAKTPSTLLPREHLERLRRSSRLLILWCDEDDSAVERDERRPAAATFEQLAGEPDLICLGPIGGISSDGAIAVLEAIKAIEQPTVLHLRLKPHSRASEAETRPNLSGDAASGHAAVAELPPAPLSSQSSTGNGHANGAGAKLDRRAKTRDLALFPASPTEIAATHLARLAHSDPRILAVDLSGGESWRPFAEALPDRYFKATAGDPEAIGWCSGLAEGGCLPVVALSESALPRCSTRVSEEFGDLQRPVTLIVSAERCEPVIDDRPRGFVLPLEMAVMVPGDAAELGQMLTCAVWGESPAMIWIPASLPGDCPACNANDPAGRAAAEIEFGRAAVLKKGVDVAIMAIGGGVAVACQAAEQLALQGVSASVLNLRFARPLDQPAILETARGARAVAIIDEDISKLSPGAVTEIIALLQGERPAAVIGAIDRRDRRSLPDPQDSAYAQDSRRGHNRRLSHSPQVDHVVRHCAKLLEACLPAMTSGGLENAISVQSLESEISTHSAQSERRQILELEFTPTVAAWVREYAEVGERSLYLWRWCLHGVGLTTLPCVSAELREHACETKFLSGMLNVLMDDVSDRKRNGDLLDELLKMTGGSVGDFTRFSAADRQYAEFTRRMWNVFWERVRQYPNFAAYKDLLQYDLTQLFNTVRYSHLVNDNLFLLNQIEHDNYSPQGMGLMSFSTVDLMCSDRFPRHELAALREAVWHAQWMARIGNLITTWQREIGDGDYSSGVFARAVGFRDLTIEQLRSGSAAEIEAGVRRGEHEAHFLRRWNYHRERLRSMRPCVQSFDLNSFVEGLERLLLTELASRGRK